MVIKNDTFNSTPKKKNATFKGEAKKFEENDFSFFAFFNKYINIFGLWLL